MSHLDASKTKAWKELNLHYKEMKTKSLKDLFEENKTRFQDFSFEVPSFLIDFSKNHINEKTISLFAHCAKEIDLKKSIKDMFSGEKINETENRAVLHTALRNLTNESILVDGENVLPKVHKVLDQIEKFSNEIIKGKKTGYTSKKFTDIINIGIGGSDLGPAMISKALEAYRVKDIHTHYISNVDSADLMTTLETLNPETTLFIIVSKTFTTLETMTNAISAKNWFLKNSNNDIKDIAKHFVAVSTNEEEVQKFGIDSQNIFHFWNWVGGRYSAWSSVSLSIACSIGYENFKEFLLGAFEMDTHFKTTPFEKNIPFLLAIVGIWYNNFYQYETHAILPYSHLLSRFPAYLQQAEMESNGKSVDRDGNTLSHQSGAIIWGEPGTNAQHSFFQLLHQGSKIIPCDFIASVENAYSVGDHQEKLMANFLAQTQALMNGKTYQEVEEELKKQNMNEKDIQKLAPFKVFKGDRPTTSILMQKVSPKTLGALIALYEHKIFVQGIFWNVFSFDQWGVELGKVLAKNLLTSINDKKETTKYDSSTNGLINYYKNHKI